MNISLDYPRTGRRRHCGYCHRYDALSFGSWVVEAGTRHRRVRATYDGREGLLRLEEAVVNSNSSPAEWREQESQVVTAMAAWDRAREVIVRSSPALTDKDRGTRDCHDGRPRGREPSLRWRRRPAQVRHCRTRGVPSGLRRQPGAFAKDHILTTILTVR